MNNRCTSPQAGALPPHLRRLLTALDDAPAGLATAMLALLPAGERALLGTARAGAPRLPAPPDDDPARLAALHARFELAVTAVRQRPDAGAR